MYFIGVDLGGTNIASALVNEKGEIVNSTIIPTEAQKGPDYVMSNMKREIHKLIDSAVDSKIAGIGLGIPGLVDIDKGMSLFAGNLGWQNIPVLEQFQNEFDVPVCMDNDVRTAALGEKHFGAGVGIDNLICITLGTGIGSGIILDGKIYRGHSLSAGEIGHITIVKDGLYCNCGNRGCLEMYASAPGIVRRTQKYILKGHNTVITSMVDGNLDKITTKTLSQAWEKGDELAQLVIDETAEFLGIGLATFAHLINPEVIIIGGGVSLMGDKLFNPLQRYFDEHSMRILRNKVPIIPAKLKSESGTVGAAALAMINLGIL